ncbi:MAG: SLC13 family permease [Bacteroidales bacterium]|jgi:di/tricarboxylate transporter|nr:SLC13 family permease [Bacteroidales bacterium]MDD3527618.1 SLC13 family permease [Bacteroidales bacterium]MDD4178326.1 SLC13 family permease [Bacteroidales bacterium]MDD4742097.1 SLC13 family permease [Bacteroidales bacterium]NCU36771.1 SLC13 family permease [Candidatus Falkowbacteria bacterium]
MLTFEGIIVLAVIIFIIVSLYTGLTGPAYTFIAGILVLGMFGILTPAEILSGFANEQILIILMLLMIGEMIRNTGVLEGFFDYFFKRAKTYRGFMTRMVLSVSTLSAFLNNTPLVAILMPYVNTWSQRNKVSPSKLLIPLSYAAILGGTATLIGTSTNLIVNGLVQAQTVIPGFATFDIFDFAWAGLPMIVLGSLFLIFFSNKLLPSRRDVMDDFVENTRRYLVETRIRSESSLPGKSVKQAELRSLKGLFLAEIIRGDTRLRPVNPNEILQKEDVLVFAGDTNTIAELVKTRSGLELSELGMYRRKDHTEAIEVVISHNSNLAGNTVKEAMIRSKYDAAVVALHRNGERIAGKLGHIRLRPGDVLLLIAGNDFDKLSMNTQDFYLISRVKDYRRTKAYESVLLIGGLMLAVFLSATKLVSLFLSLAILITIVLLIKLINPKELPKMVDFNLAIIIAMSLALGIAMLKSGVAGHIGFFLVDILIPFGTLTILFGIYIISALLSAYINNKAAVAILFPIMLTISIKMNVDPMPLVLIMTYAAAASFLTPIGYQTNLMVYGPGGYTFRDFFKIGLPLTLMYMVVSVGIVYAVFF